MKKWINIDGKDVITSEYAQFLFESSKNLVLNGKEYYDLYEQHGYSHSVTSCIEGGSHYAQNRWNTVFDTTEKYWYRIGDVLYDYNYQDFFPSKNHSEDAGELAVSVIDKDWLSSVSAQFFDTSRGIYELKGVQVGWGSDGEPVVVPTSIPKFISNDINDILGVIS